MLRAGLTIPRHEKEGGAAANILSTVLPEVMSPNSIDIYHNHLSPPLFGDIYISIFIYIISRYILHFLHFMV